MPREIWALLLLFAQIVSLSDIHESITTAISQGKKNVIIGSGPCDVERLVLNSSLRIRSARPRKEGIGGTVLRASDNSYPTIEVSVKNNSILPKLSVIT
jgi:hypothetical protein